MFSSSKEEDRIAYTEMIVNILFDIQRVGGLFVEIITYDGYAQVKKCKEEPGKCTAAAGAR